MIFTRATEYAFKSLVYMARNADRDYFGVQELAEEIGVSPSYLAKILQKLVRAGYMKSMTGPSGGFSLKEGTEKIKLETIVKVLDDNSAINHCVLGFSQCSDKNPCPFHHRWLAFQKDLSGFMKRTRLMDVETAVWPLYGSKSKPEGALRKPGKFKKNAPSAAKKKST